MNLDTTYTTSTQSSADTRKLGARLAKVLKGGAVIELVGDLGAGKTTFTQGFLDGLGYTDEATSPTFTVSRDYTIGGRTVHHFDLYRLEGHDIVTDELAEAMAEPGDITLVEWPGHGNADLPADRLRVTLRHLEDEQHREITIEGLGSTGTIIKELRNAGRA